MVFTDTLKQKYRQNHILIFIFFLAGTLYAPVTLIWTGVIPLRYRFAVMFCILAVMVSYVLLKVPLVRSGIPTRHVKAISDVEFWNLYPIFVSSLLAA